MESFIDYMQTKRGMADALPAILAAQEGLRAHSRRLLRDAVAELIAAVAATGAVREVDPSDVLMALGGITLIASHENQRELASRLIKLLMAGLNL